MTETITISKIYFNQTNREQQPYFDRAGRPFQMVKLVAQDGRTLWGKAYQGSPILSWKPGEAHEVETEVKDSGFINFRLTRAHFGARNGYQGPSMAATGSEKVQHLENMRANQFPAKPTLEDRVSKLESQIEQILPRLEGENQEEGPDYGNY